MRLQKAHRNLQYEPQSNYILTAQLTDRLQQASDLTLRDVCQFGVALRRKDLRMACGLDLGMDTYRKRSTSRDGFIST